MGSPGVEPLFLLKRQVLPPLGRPRVEPLLVKRHTARGRPTRDMWGWADGKPPTGRIIILLRNHKVKIFLSSFTKKKDADTLTIINASGYGKWSMVRRWLPTIP